MKKYILLSLLFCSTFVLPHSTVIVGEKKIAPYSVQWLYDLYEQSPESIITKNVHENLPYFRHMMHSYIKNVSLAIEHQDSFVARKAAKDVAAIAGSLGLVCGSLKLCHFSIEVPQREQDREIECLCYGLGGFFSACVGVAFFIVLTPALYKTMTYKQWLAHRYEVGKKILEQLEQADGTTY